MSIFSNYACFSYFMLYMFCQFGSYERFKKRARKRLNKVISATIESKLNFKSPSKMGVGIEHCQFLPPNVSRKFVSNLNFNPKVIRS